MKPNVIDISPDEYLEKLNEILATSGLPGLARTGLRIGVEYARDSLDVFGEYLRHLEANHRLSKVQRAQLDRNRKFRGFHEGEPAFIIGNGPSLKHQDLKPLGDELTFTCNKFWAHDITEHWEPSYYFVTDSEFYSGDDSSLKFFAELKRTISDSTFFLHVLYYDVVREHGILDGRDVYFIARGGFLPRSSFYREVDLTKVLPSPSSVIQAAMMTAIYMGCSPIYLLGLDHDWLEDLENYEHFYQGETLEEYDATAENRIYQDYLSLLQYVSKVWMSHYKIKELAGAAGIEIVNLTHGGRLDVFPRKQLDEVV